MLARSFHSLTKPPSQLSGFTVKQCSAILFPCWEPTGEDAAVSVCSSFPLPHDGANPFTAARADSPIPAPPDLSPKVTLPIYDFQRVEWGIDC